REEEQRRGTPCLFGGRGEQLVELLRGHGELELEVAVGELAALRAPRGPGGVDQGGETVRPRLRTTGLELVVGDVGPQPGEHVDGAPLDRPHVMELVEPVTTLPDPGQV